MQIKKTYYSLNPELLFDEIKDFVAKQGAAVDESKLETYSLPNDSSTFISRGTLTFKINGKECARAHIIGSVKTEVKMLLDINDTLFSGNQVTALTEDIDFIFSTYEKKPR